MSSIDKTTEESKQKAEQEKRAEIDQVLAELCIGAPSTIVKQCLQCYQYRKSLKQLKAAFMTFKLNELKETYQHMVPDDAFIPRTKESLTHSIVCKFQNYMSDKCCYCKQFYRFKHNDHPLMECRICGQEVHRPCFLKSIGENEDSRMTAHDALNKVNPYGLPFLFYICQPCSSKVIPEEVKSGQNSRNGTLPSNDERDTDTRTENSTLLNQSVMQPELHDEQNDTIDTREETETIPVMQPNVGDENLRKVKVCSFYERGVCKHGRKGESCKFAHPPFCKKFLAHGTKKGRGCDGNNCKYHHPPMCKTSLKTGTCYKQNCTKRHVKHTSFERVERKKKTLLQEQKSSSKQNDFLLEFLEKMKDDLSKQIESKIQDSLNALPLKTIQNQWPAPVVPPGHRFPQNPMMAGFYNLPQFRPIQPRGPALNAQA